MTETNAKTVAGILGGTAINSGGGIWLVRIDKWNGRIVFVSDERATEYEDEDAMTAGRELASVDFA